MRRRLKVEKLANCQTARAILGKNFFGVEEWIALYGAKFTEKQLQEIPEFPWKEKALNASCPFIKDKAVKETHFAFLGLENINGKPLTVLQLQELHPANSQPRFYSYAPGCWYAKETWATQSTPKFRWYLLPLEFIPNSETKTYQEQLAMLPQDYEVPTTVVEVLKELLYCRKNDLYLNSDRYGKTSDIKSSNGSLIHVGGFGGEGLGIVGYDWDGFGWDYLGIALSKIKV